MNLSAKLLTEIAARAAAADAARTVDPRTIEQLRENPVMAMTASANIGGSQSSIVDIGHELQALAAACTSTAWCLWNHLSTFHLFCGLLGPNNKPLLEQIVHNQEWVCFPAGASTAIQGTPQGDRVELTGQAAFGSGARYAQWTGASFMCEGDDMPSFGMVYLDQRGVRIDPTWKAMSLRASATDHVLYDRARIPAATVVPFPMRYRVAFRDPSRGMVHHRYREDWVALSNMWLGAMAVGLTRACLRETAENIKERIAIMGVKMVERPTIHVNLGNAESLIRAAEDTVFGACTETDERLSRMVIPSEEDYLRQMSAAMQAVILCEQAIDLNLRVLGGNGLREGENFERRFRDFQAMPLHINIHRDRVSEQVGRNLLGLETTNLF